MCFDAPTNTKTIASKFENASTVFLGTIKEKRIRERELGSSEISEVDARVIVIERFKGVQDGDEIWITSTRSSCQAPFRVGDTFLILAQRREADDRLTLNACDMAKYHTVDELLKDQNARFKESAEPALDVLRKIR